MLDLSSNIGHLIELHIMSNPMKNISLYNKCSILTKTNKHVYIVIQYLLILYFLS